MYKKLLFTSVSAIVLINTQPSLAEETLIDLSDKPITTPTLDYLHEKGMTMPETDKVYPQSAYTITPGTEDDYSFIAPIADVEGKITKEYYKINFKNTDRMTWTPDGDRTLTLNLPNAENPTEYKYTVNVPDGAEGMRISGGTINAADVTDKVFKDIVSGGTYISGSGSYRNYGGGVILNTSDNENINIVSTFINNDVQREARINGGVIYNGRKAKLGDITGDFIDNSAQGLYFVWGGAIYNAYSAIVGNVNGNFIGNYVQGSFSDGGVIGGGAIYNAWYASVGNITGDFISNYAKLTGIQNSAEGGAIYNEQGTIGNIIGDFIGNYVQGSYSNNGGAIYNYRGTIGNITGDFINNTAASEESLASEGGAIYNAWYASVGNITGNFIGNYAQGSRSEGGAIYNGYNGRIGNETIGIKGNFIGNKAIATSSSAYGGAIYNDSMITLLEGDFIVNHALATGSTSYSYTYGGAIYNSGTIGDIINSSFLGNYVSGNEESQGGAIYSIKDMTIIADNGISEFSGNYVHINPTEATEDTPAVEEKTIPNAIYMKKQVSLSKGQTLADVTPEQIANLNLVAQNNGQIIFNDEIDGKVMVKGYGPSSSWADTELGVLNYALNIDGDSTGTVTFNNHIRNADITLSNTNMIVDKAEYLGDNDNLLIQSGNLTINSGEMTIKQLGMNTLNFKSLAMPGGLLRVDSLTVDLANQTSGMITADTASGGAGKIKVESVLLTSDGQAGSTPVQFVSEDISKEVTTDVTEALAPIYKYGVEYNNESGKFIFTRGDLVEPEPEPDTPVDPGTPSVPVTPIRPITPAYKAFNPGVFANDVFAMSSMNTQGEVAKQVFDMDTNREYCFGRIWATPYYSDDTIGYSGFYDVDSKNYGLIAGVDSKAYALGKNWTSVYTAFGAYNDGEDKYQGVKVDSKSWLVGLKASVYNGGFYGDAIVNYAWHDSDQKTAFGTDSVDSTGYGAALKAGYKHEFDNRLSLDTSAMLSWQTIEGDDFTSKSGARISTDDYSRLTLTPRVKLGYSFEKVKPYALVRYNFVLDEDGRSTVNHLSNRIALPEIESKDYVEYGLGLETVDAFPHSGYAHVLRHDGGREGWSVTAGYKYNF